MSATWYPVIDMEKCTECQACFNKCSHGVYELRGSRPVVVNPDGCVQGCTGCEKLCPTGAIDYIGRGAVKESSCCSCGGNCWNWEARADGIIRTELSFGAKPLPCS